MVDATLPNTPVGCLDLSLFMLHIKENSFPFIFPANNLKGFLAANCIFLLCCKKKKKKSSKSKAALVYKCA